MPPPQTHTHSHTYTQAFTVVQWWLGWWEYLYYVMMSLEIR